MAETIEVVHPGGRPQPRTIHASALQTYLDRGFVVVGDAGEDPDGGAPSPGATKREWVAYAEGLGIDVSSMSKPDVIAAVGQAEDSD